jgi:hypothetical protein
MKLGIIFSAVGSAPLLDLSAALPLSNQVFLRKRTPSSRGLKYERYLGLNPLPDVG